MVTPIAGCHLHLWYDLVWSGVWDWYWVLIQACSLCLCGVPLLMSVVIVLFSLDQKGHTLLKSSLINRIAYTNFIGRRCMRPRVSGSSSGASAHRLCSEWESLVFIIDWWNLFLICHELVSVCHGFERLVWEEDIAVGALHDCVVHGRIFGCGSGEVPHTNESALVPDELGLGLTCVVIEHVDTISVFMHLIAIWGLVQFIVN